MGKMSNDLHGSSNHSFYLLLILDLVYLFGVIIWISRLTFALLIGRVIRVPLSTVLEGAIKRRTVIRIQWMTFLQSLNQIRRADEVAADGEGVIAALLQHSPYVCIVPSAG